MAECTPTRKRHFDMEKIVITGIGHFHPENRIPNEFFETLEIGSSNDWVRERTGIQSRHSVLTAEQIASVRFKKTSFSEIRAQGLMPSMASMAAIPWQQAKIRSRSDSNPDFLICGTSVPDFDIPANASSIASSLGIASTCFDANSACSSFVTDLLVANGLLKSQAAKKIALFNVERYSTKLDYENRANCILFGDGAASTIVERGSNITSGLELIDVILRSDPSGYDYVKIPVEELFYQDGQRVQKFAITKTCDITKEILQRNNLSIGNINYFIGHQANLRMLETVTKRLELTDQQHLHNIKEFGNQGGAGAPCVLSQNWDLIKSGDLVVVAVVGAGLTWGAALLKKL